MSGELIGIIGGTGLGDALAKELKNVQTQEVETPFGRPSGPIMAGTLGARRVAFLNRHGEGHKLSPSEVPFAANIFALKKLGVHAVIASGAVGSLQANVAPGDLVVVDQFIDKTFKRANTFFTGFGAVHCEMAEPACGRLRETLVHAAIPLNVTTHPGGTYVCMEGPQFSTRAESLMHRTWGGDLIGMTAMPEAKLAREAQMCYALVALASDYDAWRKHDPHVAQPPSAGKPQESPPRAGVPHKAKQTLLQEILSNLHKATDNCLALIRSVLAGDTPLVDETCSCRKSLELAVWTSPARITSAEKERLAVLFE
ncbi:MAG: S-methyl-5'-thioadenosine phosphorylase [Sedimentisphaerales bacterium]|nr:S-methyl-5'-thioadenosine phosphorylase [Sedimentisphaerales bacterium]